MRPATPSGPAGRSCRDAALLLLGRRDHTRLELRRKLRRRGFEEAEIESVLLDLGSSGLVGDAATAAALARSAVSRGRGRRAIAADLAGRGVTREDGRRALDALDPGEEAAALQRALERKASGLPARLTPPERSKKLFDHLVRRGFPADAVREALRQKGAPVHDEED